MEKVLDACAQLPSLGSDAGSLRDFLTEASRKIFAANIAGMLVREGETYSLSAIAGPVKEGSTRTALLSHVQSFATQAIDNKKLLNFRFSYREEDSDFVYYGLALPLVTAQAAAALLVVRRTVFSPSEIAAFNLLGNTARMALDNVELAALNSAQQKSLTQLLEVSAELSNAGRLDSFLHSFVVRAAEFLGFERAFIAVLETSDCRVRWSALNGSPARVDVDFSSAAHRIFE